MLPRRFSTPRLRLREPVATDASKIFRSYTQDAQVCRYMILAPHAAEAVTHEYIDSCIDLWKTGESLPYVITRHDTDAPIGTIEARPQGTAVDIGYVLARAHCR